jgi:hypothetical protein
MFKTTTLLAALALTLSAPALAFAAGSLGANGGTSEIKICKNTHHPGGIRCTFCYYTTQPGSGSTVCIKLNTGNSNNNKPAQSLAN